MRRRWFGAALAVAVAGSSAGCGDDGDSAVGDYVKAANAICAEMDSKGKPINDALFRDGPPTADKLQAWAGQIAPIMEDGIGRLVALEPPESKRSEVAKLNQEGEHGLATLREIARDRAAADRALQSETDGFDRFGRQAGEVGLDKCAGDADPGNE